MRSRLEARSSALRSPWPWLALAASLGLTIAGWFAVERASREDARIQFERRTETAAGAIRARLTAYEQVLRSAAAYMASSTAVSRQDFRRFVTNLQLDERFPGIQSVGYAEVVRAAAHAEHVQRLRAEGFRDYDTHPPGVRDDMAVVLYNEPFTGRNARVIGYDMASEPARSAAMRRARDSGEVAITSRVLLTGEGFTGSPAQQAGIVMYVPVYLEKLSDLSRRDRHNAVAGYVFAPFRVQDLMRGILDEGVLQVLDMRVYDEAAGGGPQPELLDTRLPPRDGSSLRPAFERVMSFPMPARNWTIQFVSRPDADVQMRADKPWIVLGGGVFGSAVVFLLVLALVEAWNKTHHLSMRDPLTGLFNRRYLEETMTREVPRAIRSGESIGVVVLDLDHFKKLNDTHGHEAGDFVLERFGELLRTATRGSDIACRFGGEEFGLILLGASMEVTCARADAIRASFSALHFDFHGKSLSGLTVSGGVSALCGERCDWAKVLREADRALYAAKSEGRNRVKCMAEGNAC